MLVNLSNPLLVNTLKSLLNFILRVKDRRGNSTVENTLIYPICPKKTFFSLVVKRINLEVDYLTIELQKRDLDILKDVIDFRGLSAETIINKHFDNKKRYGYRRLKKLKDANLYVITSEKPAYYRHLSPKNGLFYFNEVISR